MFYFQIETKTQALTSVNKLWKDNFGARQLSSLCCSMISSRNGTDT